ncbi:MAG TPA: DUF1592 domain-containing protein, partial [Polyangiaceae bacterium]|nr:DUF1592 domain-containing protein [Polyangiaceae bacterium]
TGSIHQTGTEGGNDGTAASTTAGTSGGSVPIDPETGEPIETTATAAAASGATGVTGATGATGTSGTTNGGTTGPTGGEPGVDPSVPATPLAECDTPGPRMIRRLTAAQYTNTLKQLLGEGFPAEEVLSDPAVLGFHVDADAALVSDLTAELLMNYAERVSAWTIENQLWKLASCQNHDQACHEQVIREFGRRAFRQDPTAEQTQTYLQLFAAEASFEAGLHVVVSTMLQSPYLLYRRELGEPDPSNAGQYQLTPYEIASELSYLITDSPPDDQLLDLAAQGRLSTREEIDQVAYGLLSREEAKLGLTRFVHGWLEVDNLFKKAKDPSVYDLSESMRQAMLDETSHFFLELFQTGGSIGELYSADFTMLNGPLAEFYGLGGASGDGFTRVALEGRRATGILGHGSFLTEHSLPENSSPVQRGVIVRERLLCQDLPPVPEDLDTNLAQPGGFANNRERYAQHSASAVCAQCHSTIDPVGFAFEEYDAFGRLRDQDMGSPIDASGELSEVVGGPIGLNGLQSLNDYLGISDEARSCLIRYWSYYAYGRDEWPAHECNHDGIRAEAAESGYTLQDTLMAIIHAPHFTRRVAD